MIHEQELDNGLINETLPEALIRIKSYVRDFAILKEHFPKAPGRTILEDCITKQRKIKLSTIDNLAKSLSLVHNLDLSNKEFFPVVLIKQNTCEIEDLGKDSRIYDPVNIYLLEVLTLYSKRYDFTDSEINFISGTKGNFFNKLASGRLRNDNLENLCFRFGLSPKYLIEKEQIKELNRGNELRMQNAFDEQKTLIKSYLGKNPCLQNKKFANNFFRVTDQIREKYKI